MGGDLGKSLKAAAAGIESKKRRDDRQAKAPKAKKPRGKRAGGKSTRDSSGMLSSERQAVNALVSPEAQRHGLFREVDFKIQEVVEGGKVKAKTVRVIRNLGGTPIERWHSRGALNERQLAAILFYQHAWHQWIGEPRVVANWSAVIVRDAQGAAEIYAGSKLAAKESLRLLDQEVFFRLPIEHFHVFQNVVIWDEPAGIAGSRAGFLHKPAEAVARVIVSTIASMIADIVIDSSRQDFEAQLRDLDAPRRPGRRA